MKNIIIIEGIRYVYNHIILYCPILESEKKNAKYGITLILQGMTEKVRILFDSKEERDEKLYELDSHFGLISTTTPKNNDPLFFLDQEAKNSGYLLKG